MFTRAIYVYASGLALGFSDEQTNEKRERENDDLLGLRLLTAILPWLVIVIFLLFSLLFCL